MPENYSALKAILNGIIILFLMSGTTSAQQAKSDKSYNELLEATEAFYGSDDVLVNGRKYVPVHFIADGDPYFPDANWNKGSVVMDGKLLKNVDLLYNAETDQIILRTKISSGDTVFVALNNEKVHSFNLGGHSFIQANRLHSNQPFSGFFEEIYNGSFTFLIKHQKTFIAEYSKTFPNGHYSKLNSTNFIFNNGQLTKVTSKKAFLNYFSPNSKAIKAFMKKNKINYSKANHSTLKRLLIYCDELSSGKI